MMPLKPVTVVEAIDVKAASAPQGPKAVDRNLMKVAEEFEGVLLRQLIQAAKVGGKKADEGYGGMVVDALASGIQAGGGVGMARAIEQALSHTLVPAPSEPGTLRR